MGEDPLLRESRAGTRRVRYFRRQPGPGQALWESLLHARRASSIRPRAFRLVASFPWQELVLMYPLHALRSQ